MVFHTLIIRIQDRDLEWVAKWIGRNVPSILIFVINIVDGPLGCTDAAPRPAHPRPTRWDTATREGRRRPRVRVASCHVAIPESGRRGWNRRRRGPNRADSVRIGLYRPKWPSQAEIKKKKKKKGAKCTVWLNLNTQTPSNPHTSSKTPKHPLSLRPSSPFSVCFVPHLSSLCFELSVSAVCTLHCFSL